MMFIFSSKNNKAIQSSHNFGVYSWIVKLFNNVHEQVTEYSSYKWMTKIKIAAVVEDTKTTA